MPKYQKNTLFLTDKVVVDDRGNVIVDDPNIISAIVAAKTSNSNQAGALGSDPTNDGCTNDSDCKGTTNTNCHNTGTCDRSGIGIGQ